jgi:hypothetical protein
MAGDIPKMLDEIWYHSSQKVSSQLKSYSRRGYHKVCLEKRCVDQLALKRLSMGSMRKCDNTAYSSAGVPFEKQKEGDN